VDTLVAPQQGTDWSDQGGLETRPKEYERRVVGFFA
jgi:hypothetical protein